jgi:hypothetical protein
MDETLNHPISARDPRPQQLQPRAMGRARAHSGVPALLRAGVVGGLVLLIFFPRFQLNVGPYFANVGLIAQFLLIGLLLMHNALRIDGVRAALFGVCVAVMFASWILSPTRTSGLSALLLVVAYLAYATVARLPDGNEALSRFTLNTFCNLMLVAAAAGIAQFFIQFVYKPAWLFDYTSYIPLLFRGGGTYNTVIPVSGWFVKSNGFFFREPSTCSQYLALALICEIAMNRRKQRKLSLPRLGTLGLALLVTYSGTGLATLVIGMMFPLGIKTMVRMGLLGASALLILSTLGPALNLSFTANRVSEFSNPGTSAYARFVAPVEFITNQMGSATVPIVIGHGPGSVTRSVVHRGGYENADPTWAKVLFEYGIVGLAAFGGLMLYSTTRSRAPVELVAAVNVGWMIIWGGVFLAPEMTGLIFILTAVAPAFRSNAGPPRNRLVVDVGQLSAAPPRR